MNTAQQCPVCLGKGQLPLGFYSWRNSTASSMIPICKTCGGGGYILVNQDSCYECFNRNQCNKE